MGIPSVRRRQIFGWILISIGILFFLSMLAAGEEDFLNPGVITTIICAIVLPIFAGILLLQRAKKIKKEMEESIKESATLKKEEKVEKEAVIYEAGMSITSPSSNCPSCQVEQIPINLGYACSREGKFFDNNLKEILRPFSSLPFVLATLKEEISINAPNMINEFLPILESKLRDTKLSFKKMKRDGSEGFRIRSSSLLTYTIVLCEQDDLNLKLKFSLLNRGGWLRFLLVMLFIIPGVVAAFLGGFQIKKNNYLLDNAILASFEELRSYIRLQIRN